VNKHNHTQASRFGVVRFVAAAALLLGGQAAFGAVDCANPRKADGGMNEPVYRAVEQANKDLSEKRPDAAISALTKMADGEITPYEKAIVYYNLGFAYNMKDQMGKSAEAFQKAIDLNALPQAQHEQLLYNTGQLYVLNQQYDKGISILQRYFEESCAKVQPEAYAFLANAYAEKKQFQQAVNWIDKAIAASDKPKESWYQAKLAMHYELKQYQACADTLVKMISTSPQKPEYWKQLSSMFFELKNDSKAVATLALAERQGFVTKPNEIKNLYAMYMMLEVPYKAGLLYEDAIAKGRVPNNEDSKEKLAGAWINARELPKAEKVLTDLASSTGKGKYYFQLGAMYGDNERWDDSIKNLQEAAKRGGVDKPGLLYMRLAVAYYNKQRIGDARGALQTALKYDESRRQAAEWLNYLKAEEEPAA